MEQIRIQAMVIDKKESKARPGTFFVTAMSKDFGEVKFVSKKKALKVGHWVSLKSQKLRAMTDQIRWEEV